MKLQHAAHEETLMLLQMAVDGQRAIPTKLYLEISLALFCTDLYFMVMHT